MSKKVKTCEPNSGCCSPNQDSDKPSGQNIVRRDFLKVMGLMTGGLILDFPVMARTNLKSDYTIPVDKKLSAKWYKSLYERGETEVYSGKELAYIGMPIGGLFSGTVYLGGDGKLWLWDIFNEYKEGVRNITLQDWEGKQKVKPRDGANFIIPVSPEYPFEQGFGIKIDKDGKTWERSLDFKGFDDITFKGQYPLAEVKYRDSELPVEINLQSFSPFIPLDLDASSYPSTIMHYKVTNKLSEKVNIELSGWLENAVLNNSENNTKVKLINSIDEAAGNIILSCAAHTDSEEIKNHADFGNMSLLLMDSVENSKGEAGVQFQTDNKLFFPNNDGKYASAEHGEQLLGALSKNVTLKSGETVEITFIISWYFPNLQLHPKAKSGYRHYRKNFKNSEEVALEIAEKFSDLYIKTTTWRDTFYNNSTLPHWFLNRTFLNTSTLATETCYLLDDGRFWAWEGIGCCPGTCTHVWHYAQAMGRLFPEVEKRLRENTDFAIIDESTGGIDFRGGINVDKYAADGQAGIVLRAFRDYQTSADDTFLKNNWDNIKLTLKYLIDLDEEDGKANGTIYGEQHNTLDAEWYGNIPVITSLYLAALAASIEMAKVMNDTNAENEYRSILEKGKKNIEKLFNGEYFVQNEDPDHKDAIGIGAGCYIDQVFGQGWAFQVGLGRLYNEKMINSALDSLWKYNFVPDVGPFRKSMSPKINGRPYAIDGDAGMVMCTWPLGGKRDDWEKHWQFGYFNECMTGFEHQVASHMIWENKLDYGLSVIKAIHERYGAGKRNPYNEIECSDHYARAMASYGAFIAACGFTYNGPKGKIGFVPKLNPDNFKAAFTGSTGWGSLQQIRTVTSQVNTIQILNGKLELQEIEVKIPEGKLPISVQHTLNHKPIDATMKKVGDKTIFLFNRIELKEKDTISINFELGSL